MGKSAQARLLASTAMLLVWMNGATASAQSPQGGVVSAGSASITRSGGATVITQTTERGVIDWRSFSVGPQEAVRFDQPGRSSVTLNRVTGSELSRIDGRISANGQVWLANPNGVVIGPSGQVNVGGLLATTGRIDAQEFLRSGRAAIDEIARDAAIVNSGAVTIAEGGYAALAAASIRNDGVIAARAGSVALAAGRATTLDFTGDKLIQYQVTQPLDQAPAEGEPGIVNVGTLAAPGGAVLLSARAAKGVIDNVINLKGHVVANSVRIEGGAVIFGDGGTVQIAAKIDASDPNGVGGAVSALGEKVGLMDGATIDASGAKGGGVVLIGGDWQGKGAERNAVVAYVASGAAINVDATERGDGGKAVVWADDTTRFNGSISARGGVLGGHGGKVETSGKRALQVGGAAGVSTAARANGARPGSWLLDPNNITVAVGGETNISGAQTFTATTDAASTINASTLQTALGTGNVILQTTTANSSGAGDITIGTGVSISYAGANSLSFLADRHVTMASGSTINMTGAGSITFNARYAGASIGAVSISGHAIVGSGALVIGGGATPLTGAAVGGGGQTTGVLISGRLDSSGGAITINGKGASTGGYGFQLNSGTISGGGGNVTISGTGDGTPASSTGIGLSNNALISSSGAITVTGVGSASGGSGSYGLDFYNSTIAATGAGTIDLALTAGGGGSQGLWLNGANMSIATGALTVKTNSIGTGGTIAIAGGTGSITLQGNAATASLGFNGGSGGFNVDPLLAAITGTPTQVTLGRTDMTGNVTGGATAYALPFNLKIQTNSGNVNIASTVNSGVSGARSLTVASTSGTTSFAGAIGGSTPLASVSVTSGTTYLNGGVTTSQASTGSISLAGRVILASSATLTTNNAPINVAQVDALNSGVQALAFAAGTAAVTLDVGSNFGLGSSGQFSTINSSGSGGIVSNLGGGRLQSSGTQSYAGPVTLVGSGLFLSTSNADVIFSGGVNANTSGGAFLTANNGTGTLSLTGGVGATTSMGSLTFGSVAAGGLIRSASTTAAIQFTSLRALSNLTVNGNGGVSVTGAATAGATGVGLSFMAPSGKTINLSTIGGGTTALDSLTLSSGATTVLGGNVTTTNSQSFGGALIIGASVTLSTTNNANITVAGAVNANTGAQSLTFNTGTGSLSLGGGVGATTPLSSLVSTPSLGTVFLGGPVTTSGLQSYGNVLVLNSSLTLNTTANGNVVVNGALNGATGAQALTVSTGTGTFQSTNQIGDGTGLGSLTQSSGTFTTAGSVRTSGTQSFGAVVLTGSSVFSTTNASITMGSLDGAVSPTFNTGTASLNLPNGAGATTPLTSLTASNLAFGGTVRSTGNQSYGGVVVTSNGSLSTTSGNLIAATVDGSPTNNRNLEIATGTGTATLSGAVGALTALANFKVGAVQLGSQVRTSVSQSYAGSVLLTGTTTLNSGGAITIDSTVNGPHFLDIVANGAVSLGSVTVSTLRVATSFGISQTGPLVVSGVTNLITGGGAVNLGTIATNEFATLSLSGGSGSANIRDGVGGLTLGNLTAGALTLASPGAINSTSPFTASSVSVSAVGGSITNATINGQTGAAGAGLVVVTSGNLTVNGVLLTATATTASTPSTPSVASTPSQASVATVLTTASIQTQASVPSLASAPSLSSVASFSPTVATTPVVAAVAQIFAPASVNRLSSTADPASVLAQILLLIPSVNFNLGDGLRATGATGGEGVSSPTAAQANAAVANTPSGALIPPTPPFLVDTGAPLASSRTIKVDAIDSGGGGQVIATGGEPSVVVRGLLSESRLARGGDARGVEPPLAQQPSTLNEESMLD